MKIRTVCMVMALYSGSILMGMERTRYGEELAAWQRASMVKVMQEMRQLGWQGAMEQLYNEAVLLNQAFDSALANIARKDENLGRYQCEFCQMYSDSVFGFLGLVERFRLLNIVHAITPEILQENKDYRDLYGKTIFQIEKLGNTKIEN